MSKKPNIRSAATDFVFVAIALAAGWAGAAAVWFAVIFAVATLAWWWTRRAALSAMSPRTRLTQSAIALLMLAAVLGLFYWMGLMFGGHT